jgi:teichuronic acid biosynthesis glycosyltransferase TuaC
LKVLFVSSGNTKYGISPIVKTQGQSLIANGINVNFYTIKGKGLISYIRNIFILRKHIKYNKFDIIHSHYSYSSYVAALSGAKPLVASLMGSDVKSNKISRMLLDFFQKHYWTQTIVKSAGMFQKLKLKDTEIIPNGVDLVKFTSLSKRNCQDKCAWDRNKSHILFAANPNRQEKNFPLASKAIELLRAANKIVLHVIYEIPYDEMPLYLNASDVIILSSYYEGSPNVIKEAMACNCPIVSTNVGDVEWVLGLTEGCYISSNDPIDFAHKIQLALEFAKTTCRTMGRERIIELRLDTVNVAKTLITIYQKVLK